MAVVEMGQAPRRAPSNHKCAAEEGFRNETVGRSDGWMKGLLTNADHVTEVKRRLQT